MLIYQNIFFIHQKGPADPHEIFPIFQDIFNDCKVFQRFNNPEKQWGNFFISNCFLTMKAKEHHEIRPLCYICMWQ
jgi:hypothetical protein